MAAFDGLDGYAKVASLMSRYNEYGIFRSFKALNMRNLLYFQAELTQLEQELKEIVRTDQLSDSEARHEALLQCQRLSAFKKPTKYKIDFFRDWQLLMKLRGGQSIISDDQNAWNEANEDDLVTTDNPNKVDATSTWISETLVPNYHWCIGKYHKTPVDWDPVAGIANYSDKAITRLVDTFATVVSCVFSVLSIVALNSVRSVSIRIGLTAVFTAVFCLCLAVLAEAKRIEIFAATSAFAAVQVVFIGTTGDCSCPSD
ncbi:hypothetical protein PV08_06640 [Exophiala spinifera]|uniref:DUF6594 domain-containing protein n=1 Tax=Exophiala spinifera TaxID=91928 RepID=A0A0D2B581_9EURO|nr:uncharacterized protein PV08_06640 [Exophiala spinifera]KIW13860.1 hypothetical protein PV08_06640 [Exophiala spinifera]